MKILQWVRTVSYTHLDVYKRQTLHCTCTTELCLTETTFFHKLNHWYGNKVNPHHTTTSLYLTADSINRETSTS